MEWFRQLGRAARQNPVWAVQELVFGPFRFPGHLFRVLLLTLAVIVVLTLGSTTLVWYTGLARYPMLHGLVLVLTWAAILLVPLRALFQPLILRYGGPDAVDTHGSARFATDAEARDLTGDMGLLIGRDRKTGKLLRYPGPAHLPTIAPTCSGKGVGTIIPKALIARRLRGPARTDAEGRRPGRAPRQPPAWQVRSRSRGRAVVGAAPCPLP